MPIRPPRPASFAALRVALLFLALGAPGLAPAAETAAGSASGAGAGIDFLRDVRPILSSHCFKCHGPDARTRKGGLRLDDAEAARQPAKSGARALVPGQPAASELIQRLHTEDPDEVMPPPSTKQPLSAAQKETLRRWVAAGAEYRPHWAFVPPTKPPVPETASPAPGHGVAPVRNPIDAFIRARLAREGLTPSPEADPAALVRRVYLDLIGLPPTPEEAEAFVSDPTPEAYERLVDRLLGSRHYGERWARRWLDLARYADTNGYEKDRPRSMWPWRDWVIGALNADLPFDQFTVRQLAGDLLPGATPEDRVATGFHRNTMINEEGGIDPLEYRFYSMVDRVHTTATAWLGLTMSCAQCHTHKYDPIQQTEYYGFMAFLDNADEPTADVPDPGIAARRAEAETRIAALTAALPDRFPVEDEVTWVTPAAVRVTSASGASAERLEDGSYRFGGVTPEKDDYRLAFENLPADVLLVNVEALADDALPRKGPGRAANGNFVLSEVEISASAPGVASPEPIALAAVSADFEQGGFPAAGAVDGKPGTGWAVSGEGQWNINRRATFRLARSPAGGAGSRVEVRLRQEHGAQHVLGRVRVSFGVGKPDPRPEPVRRREHFARKFEAWQEREAGRARSWTPLRPVSATSNIPVLTVEGDASVFVTSDMTKSDVYELGFRGDLTGITALRLEAMPDDRLPRRGPGRVAYEGPFGDFFLSTFSVRAGGQPVKLVRASQTHAAGGNTAERALDDDQQSGWSIDGGQGRLQVAVFNLEKPLDARDGFAVSMLFEKYYAAGLGRFRISATTDPRGAEALAWPDALQAALLRPATARTAEETEGLRRLFAESAPELASARAEIEKVRREMPAFPTTLVMQERPPENPRITRVRHRGEYLQPGEAVPAGLPAVFASLLGDRRPPRNRLEFAQWLVSRENPLTARVTMNRHWAALFGRGLVRTAEDFGFQGELPTHPELLDWLAVEFMDRGWSQKQMHRLMVTSSTYRQSSRVAPAALEKDPQNRLLARAPRFRIEGELVRDLVLQASGLLSGKIGGPSVFPPQLASITREGTYGPLDWVVSRGEDRYRRGLYTFAKRTAPYATFGIFDAPSGEACTARREVSNTPLQSLTLLNDEVFVEAARALGSRAAGGAGDDAGRVRALFRRVLTRPPTDEEVARILVFVREQRARLDRGEFAAAELAGTGDGEPRERAVWTAVARALLNLDETVTRG